jgi:hypothetical protein
METTPERANLFSFRVLFLISVIPGIIGVLALAFFVKEVTDAKKKTDENKPNYAASIRFYS